MFCYQILCAQTLGLRAPRPRLLRAGAVRRQRSRRRAGHATNTTPLHSRHVLHSSFAAAAGRVVQVYTLSFVSGPRRVACLSCVSACVTVRVSVFLSHCVCVCVRHGRGVHVCMHFVCMGLQAYIYVCIRLLLLLVTRQSVPVDRHASPPHDCLSPCLWAGTPQNPSSASAIGRCLAEVLNALPADPIVLEPVLVFASTRKHAHPLLDSGMCWPGRWL